MRNSFKIILFLIISFSHTFSQTLQKVSIQLLWLDQFQFAGYYVAKEKGFYKKVGLDVDILKYQSDVDFVQKVSQGEATYGIGRTSLLIHKENGAPIVVLSAIFQHSPAAILVTNPEILTVNNLVNKRIMISKDAITSASYMSMLFSEGIIKENIIVQKHSYDIDDLINGKTDAIASYISNEPYILEKRNIDYKYFHPKDYGYDFYGDLLYTSQQELEKNPTRVENFVNATLKGWNYAFDHIEETAQLIFEHYNTQNKSLDELIYEGKKLKELAYDKNNELGHISYKKYEDIAKTYKLLGMLPNGYSLDNFLYGVHCLTNFTLDIEERKWLMNNKTIQLASNKEWIPIEFFDEQNNYSGIAAGYLELFEEKLDVQFKLVEKSYWHKMIDKIKNKQLDMFMAIVKTPKRSEYMNFTTPYIEFPTVIVTKDDIGYIRNLEQLSGKSVAVEQNYYTQELLQQANEQIVLHKVNTTKEALQKVYNEEVFAYIGALPTIGHYIKELKYSNLKINGEAPFKTALSFGVRKDLPYLNSILQKTLNNITQEEHDAIYNKWVNIMYEYKTDTKIIYGIVLIAVLMILIFIIRNRFLQKELALRERFSTKLKDLNKKLEKKNCALKELSEVDTLTQIPNRRKCEEFLNLEIERSIRNKLPLSVVMIDVDYFKRVNDTFGHKVGDVVLHQIAQCLSSRLRVYDFIGRWGGEEFLVVCPNSDINQSHHLCQKVQKLLQEISIKEIKGQTITISAGIAQFNFNESLDSFIKRADDEMYKAKKSGRNCISPSHGFH